MAKKQLFKQRYHERVIVLSHIGPVLVDTCLVSSEKYYETIVVKCNQDASIIDWGTELDCVRYKSEDSAKRGHKAVIEKWEV